MCPIRIYYNGPFPQVRQYFYRAMAGCRGLFYLLIRTSLDEAHTAAYKLQTRELVGAACSRGIILSYPKSGRTWVETMLSSLYVRRFALPETRILDFQDDREELPGLPHFFFTHDYAHVTHGQWLIPQRRSRRHFHATPTIFIARYPIDIAVSMYFQQSRRERNLDQVNIYDFVATHRGGLETIIGFMNFWARELPQIFAHKIVRYEDLSSNAYQSFGAITRFFNLDFDDADIRKAVEFSRFDNLQRLEKEGKLADWRFSETRVEDRDDMKVRRGKVGGYKDYFDEVQCKEFERIVTETLDPVYGY